MNMNTQNADSKTKTCYVYCRVSTEEQAREGFSLDNQKRACTDYAKANGYLVKDVFVDEGKSARTVDRADYQRLLKSVKKTPVDAIIFYKIDRIFRNVADFANTRKEFKKYGD